MKVRLDHPPLADLAGNKLKAAGDKDFELQPAMINALLHFNPQTNVSGIDKYTRYKLAIRVDSATGIVELSAEEISLIKQLTGEIYIPVAVGRIWDLLEERQDESGDKAE